VGTDSDPAAVLPREAASRLITAAVSRGAWGVSVLVLVITVPVLVDVLAARGLTGRLGPPLCAVVVMLALVLLAGWRPSTATRLLGITVGSLCAFGFTTSLLLADPSLNDTGGFLLNRLATVLVLTGASIARPLAGLAWSAVGYALATLGAYLASVVAGVPFAPGWGPPSRSPCTPAPSSCSPRSVRARRPVCPTSAGSSSTPGGSTSSTSSSSAPPRSCTTPCSATSAR